MWPCKSTLVFSTHFVLTHAHPGATSRSVTHPETTPSSRLTLKFCPNGLPEKKEFLIDMSSLSSLISQAITYTPLRGNDILVGPPERSLLAHMSVLPVQYMCHVVCHDGSLLLAGSRLAPQINTSLFYALFPHSCAPGSYFPVGHPS